MHFFEPDAVNRLIPEFKGYIDRLRQLQAKIQAKQVDIDSHLIVGGTGEPSSYALSEPDIQEGVRKLNELVEIFNRILSEMYEKGYQLKNLETGLLDFYHIRGNDIVNLCWKYGEEKIDSWHSINKGFAERQKI